MVIAREPDFGRVRRALPGLEGMKLDAAVMSLGRVVGGGQLALLTDPDLSTARGRAVAEGNDARRHLQGAVAAAFRGQSPPNLEDLRRRAQEMADQLERITREVQRRTRLADRQRAEEAAVRRELVGEPTTVPRRRRHCEAEDEWQMHRQPLSPGLVAPAARR